VFSASKPRHNDLRVPPRLYPCVIMFPIFAFHFSMVLSPQLTLSSVFLFEILCFQAPIVPTLYGPPFQPFSFTGMRVPLGSFNLFENVYFLPPLRNRPLAHFQLAMLRFARLYDPSSLPGTYIGFLHALEDWLDTRYAALLLPKFSFLFLCAIFALSSEWYQFPKYPLKPTERILVPIFHLLFEEDSRVFSLLLLKATCPFLWTLFLVFSCMFHLMLFFNR